MSDIAVLAKEYLDLKTDIEEWEAKQDILRDQIKSLMPPYEDDETKAGVGVAGEWGTVTWVKPRLTTKVDVEAAKRNLALAGVHFKVIEEAFGRATKITTGEPSIRIVEAKGK